MLSIFLIIVVAMSQAGEIRTSESIVYSKVEEHQLDDHMRAGGDLVATLDGTVLFADYERNHGVEMRVRDGRALIHYPGPLDGHAVNVALSPSNERYIFFHGNKTGSALHIYNSKGQKIREILSADMVVPTHFQIDVSGKIVILGVASQLPAREVAYLIHKYDTDGRLLGRYHPFGSAGDRPEKRTVQFSRIALGRGDQIAVYRPDEKLLYWLDPEGNVVLTAPVKGRATAIGFVNDTLMAVGADETPLPSSRPGVTVARLSNPRLYVITRDGKVTEHPLPAEAAGISQIDARGNLLQVMPNRFATFTSAASQSRGRLR